ncbi:MAG: prolipoprotein diacylglyceryl transferase [Gammaproteobacteria bacterium]|nr:prolipoprotein diacylglyceryl transferase [Gammaproteobacteria bacterium]
MYIHELDPVIFSFGSINLYWYGFMYMIGFAGVWVIGRRHIKRPWINISEEHFLDFLFYSIIGVLLGGKIGYSLFYNLPNTVHNPISVFFFWEGGMSFHGGLIGVILGVIFFKIKSGISLVKLLDLSAPLAPIGLFTGRIGNFINGELWGKPTEMFYGVVFPKVDDTLRHPSQLYEALLEGIILFIILNIIASKERKKGLIAGIFLILYALFRFIVELFREPDSHIGYILFEWLTMGQILCIPMFLFGLYFICKRWE